MVNLGLTVMSVETAPLYPEHGSKMCRETFISIYKITKCNDREQYEKYILVMTCPIEEEIKERIVLGTKAYYANLKFFKSRLVTKKSKLKLYRTVIRPIVTYASETWVLK